MGNNPKHDDMNRPDHKSGQQPAQNRPGQGNTMPQQRPDDQRDRQGQGNDQKRSTDKPQTPAE